MDKGEYSNTDAALLVGYGIRLFGETHFGLTVKGVYESLAGQSAFAFGGDAGIYSRIGIVDIGIVGRNFGSKLKFNDEAYALPLQILGGASVHLKEYGLTVSAMGGSVSEGQTQFSVGAEFNPLAAAADGQVGDAERPGRMSSVADRLPGGAIQTRPRRPLPMVWRAAVIHSGPGSPARARRHTSSLVESTSSSVKRP